ncbi:fimbrillin family protein [Alistipes sp.]|jgi:hypothetical protein|uniref:fimbrillin family protein n=1 Tax=unclassified Alistipes TaxID=2608932 RepID=UPI00307ED7D9
MKRTESLYRTAVLLLLLMLAAACTRDDTFDDAAPGNATDPAAPLTIIVTDGAYAPEASAANAATDNGAPVTRAVENGFATGFTKGDKIGLYVADAKVYGPGNLNDLRITASNLCLTYDGTRWTLPADTELKYDPAKGRDILYFAYYPYQADMSGNELDGTNPDGLPAATAPEFFHRLIGSWKPQDDQSTYADYAASDLMVARGEVATRTDGTPGSTLSFKMEHQMQLNIVRLPYIKSTYTEEISGNQQTKSYYLYTGVAHVPNFWMENPHTARYITNPSGDVKKITGCSYYDSRSVERKFDIEIPRKDDLRGKYKTYTIDGGAETTTERPLAEGDFYMKNGTVLPQEHYKNSDMPQNVKDDCLGVVFWVGEKINGNGDSYHWTDGDHLLMHEHPACTHGLVVALTDVADTKIPWSSTSKDFTHEWFRGYPATGHEKEKKLMQWSDSGYGYNMTRLLQWYRDAGGQRTEALDAVEQYAKADANATPDGCSGWYFPGFYEMRVMALGTLNLNADLGMATTLNAAFTKAGGREFINDYYWESTETASIKTNANCTRFSDKSRSTSPKKDAHYVRAVLAF